MSDPIRIHGAWANGAHRPGRETTLLRRDEGTGTGFLDILEEAGQFALRAAVGFAQGGIPGAVSSALFGGAPAGAELGSLNGGQLDPMQLFRIQEEMQRRQQIFQLMTNISKTEHDGMMAIVRNMRS